MPIQDNLQWANEDPTIEPSGAQVSVIFLAANIGVADENNVSIIQTPAPGVTNISWEIVNNDDVTGVGVAEGNTGTGPLNFSGLSFAGSGSPTITGSVLRIRVTYTLPSFPPGSGLHAVTPDVVNVDGDFTDEQRQIGWTVDAGITGGTPSPVEFVYCGHLYPAGTDSVWVPGQNGNQLDNHGGYYRPVGLPWTDLIFTT